MVPMMMVQVFNQDRLEVFDAGESGRVSLGCFGVRCHLYDLMRNGDASLFNSQCGGP